MRASTFVEVNHATTRREELEVQVRKLFDYCGRPLDREPNTTRLDLRYIQMDAKSQCESFTMPAKTTKYERARAFLRSKWCQPRVT
jgi:hypothetical protein